mgnify:CR=1 FL=1
MSSRFLSRELVLGVLVLGLGLIVTRMLNEHARKRQAAAAAARATPEERRMFGAA